MTTLPALTTHQRKVLDYLLAFFEAKGYLVRNELGRRMFARPVLAAARQASAEVTA